MANRLLRRLALEALVLAARATDRWRRRSIPVLAYHAIGAACSPVSTHPATFQDRLAYLLKRGFRPVALCEAADLAANGKAFPPRSVVITFDDGYADNADPIRAILKARGRATLFLPVAHLGGTNRWDAGRPGIPSLALLSREEIVALSREGCEMGGHSLTHVDLTRLSPDDLAREVAGCCRALQDLLGRPPASFAYPYGAVNGQAVAAVRQAGVRAACTTAPGVLTARTPLLEIPRVPAGGLDSVLYRLAVHRGYAWYIGLQKLLGAFPRRRQSLSEHAG